MPDTEGVRPEAVLGPLNDLECQHAPERLFLRGDTSLLADRPKVSIVGARKASPEGLRRAAKLARILVKQNVVIVSGLAAGIDRAAHEAAIDAGGRTIAVLGTSLDKSYPRENRELQELIGRDHLLVSQFPPGTATRRWHFPQRNRTIALIIDASVIVEASDTSGSLSQGWEALRLNRALFFMLSVMDDSNLKWPAEMVQYGAQALDDDLDDVAPLLENLPYGDPLAALSA